MAQPKYRTYAVALVATTGLAIAFVNWLEWLESARRLITPSITYVSTAVVLPAYLGLWAYLSRKHKQLLGVTRLGLHSHLSILGLLAMLWFPRAADLLQRPRSPVGVPPAVLTSSRAQTWEPLRAALSPRQPGGPDSAFQPAPYYSESRSTSVGDASHIENSPVPVVPSPDVPAPNPLVNRGAFNAQAIAVLLCDRDGNFVTDLTDQVIAKLHGSRALFTDSFVATGRFERAAGGDASALIEAGVTTESASIIVVGSRTIEVTPREPAPGYRTFKVVASLSVRIYQPIDMSRSVPFRHTEIGTGFSTGDATRAADAALADRLVERVSAIR